MVDITVTDRLGNKTTWKNINNYYDVPDNHTLKIYINKQRKIVYYTDNLIGWYTEPSETDASVVEVEQNLSIQLSIIFQKILANVYALAIFMGLIYGRPHLNVYLQEKFSKKFLQDFYYLRNFLGIFRAINFPRISRS